jgi:hypothetical protein
MKEDLLNYIEAKAHKRMGEKLVNPKKLVCHFKWLHS